MECNQILKNLKVLYVEDEEPIRELMQEVLSGEFKEFQTAGDGIEGLQKFQESDFDMVITDIEMPRLDGLELAARIKKLSATTPVILLTAYSQKERLFKAIDAGVSKYLVKPFTPDKLLSVVCELAKERCDLKVLLGNNTFYDFATKTIEKSGEVVKLTKKEAAFLELLLAFSDRIVRMEEIARHLWPQGDFSEDALRALVKRVRKKSFKELIKNYPALGYKITLDADHKHVSSQTNN